MGFSASAYLFCGQVVREIEGEGPDEEEMERRLEGTRHLEYASFGYCPEGMTGVALIVKGSSTLAYDYGYAAARSTALSEELEAEAKREAAERGFPGFEPRWIVAASYG